MNRLDQLFEKKKNSVLSVFFTAGFPSPEDTLPVLKALEEAGADMAEIGFPFSDPVADGDVIQKSSRKALESGMSLQKLFSRLKDVRREVNMPLILMGYLNPVLNMGMENFLDKCRECGIDGVIIPDFPPEEFSENYREIFNRHEVHNILLITPQTNGERIRMIDRLSGGFIYMVSSYATTGAVGKFDETQLDYFQRIRDMKLHNPVLTGFGISNHKTFKQACEFSSGAIIGSAFINELEKKGPGKDIVNAFINRILIK